jgi:hypothetical protein
MQSTARLPAGSEDNAKRVAAFVEHSYAIDEGWDVPLALATWCQAEQEH